MVPEVFKVSQLTLQPQPPDSRVIAVNELGNPISIVSILYDDLSYTSAVSHSFAFCTLINL